MALIVHFFNNFAKDLSPQLHIARSIRIKCSWYDNRHMNQHERMKRLEEHIREEHKLSPVSVYLKEVVYGGVDGIITTFAVVAGFSGAALSGETTTQLSFLVVLLFGLANLFADGVSMGLGNFLAVRSEQSRYCSIYAKERHESKHNGDEEAEETRTILMQKGFTEVDARTLTDIYQKNERYWVDFMMSHELKIPDPTDENPLYTGFATFVAFVLFGVIPLIPFMLMGAQHPETVFYFSATSGLLALVLLGYVKGRVVGSGTLQSIGEVVLVGTVAATIAFTVGTFFHV